MSYVSTKYVVQDIRYYYATIVPFIKLILYPIARRHYIRITIKLIFLYEINFTIDLGLAGCHAYFL
jgi:hypothetical protein